MDSKITKKVLLTGGSGNLGGAILASGFFSNILAPSREEMDITNKGEVVDFFEKNNPDAVIHCAALVNMFEVEQNPTEAINVNIVGTSNLVSEIIQIEKNGESIKFIYISTDGVYPGTEGNYSETDKTIPYNKYGWTKLGGECAVSLLSNFCVIRTSFFDPHNIKHEFYATDKYSSRLPIDYLPKAIAFILESDFIGTVNIGGKKQSDYDKYKTIKPEIRPCTYEDIAKKSPLKISHDASMNSSLWRKIKGEIKSLKIDE